MDLVELRTQRLSLRCPIEADIPRVVEICSDTAVAEYTTVPHPYLAEHARAFVVDIIPAGWANGTALTWGIYEQSRDHLLGVVSLSQIEDASAELGYWIAPEVRGKGLMTEAATRVVDYAFAASPGGLGLIRLGWEALTVNAASARVAQKIGFSWEGERRSATSRLERRYDLTLAGLLKDDGRSEATTWPTAIVAGSRT